MLCYMDQGWCVHSEALEGTCVNDVCFRNYTIAKDAHNTLDLPLSMSDFKTEDCGYTTHDSSTSEAD